MTRAERLRRAARSLGELGLAPDQAVPALLRAMQDRVGDVRWRAAEALGRYGPAAGVAVPALVRALESDKDWLVRQAAAESLGALGPPADAAIPALTAAAKNEFEDVREAAVQALKRLAAPAPAPGGR